jgi:hypothetical protein
MEDGMSKVSKVLDSKAPSARDGQGREWHPVITCGTLRRFERMTGKSLLDPEMLQGLIERRKTADIIDLAFLACPEEVAERAVSVDDFADSFTNTDQLKALTLAMVEAINLFSQSPAPTNPEAGKSAAPGTGATSTN